jgi:mono/diheme cytochrome c family protein
MRTPPIELLNTTFDVTATTRPETEQSVSVRLSNGNEEDPVPSSTLSYRNIRVAFLLAGGLSFALLVVVTLCRAQAQDSQAQDSQVAKASISAPMIAVKPPAGMSGDPVAQPLNMPTDPTMAAKLARGQYLAVAGDCQYCHSVPGGPPFAGGQPVQTPFGDLFSPNITPDKQFGIGKWSDAQFWNALHNGISPGHSLLIFPRYLYPVMPWQDYNKLSYGDVMAIKAYLDSIQPVAQPSRPSEMQFPFTLRAGLLGWRILYFNRQPIQYDPSWSPAVRNGAFLVLALEHCGECHTQRNLLMATEPSRSLAGGHLLAQSWYAPNISSEKADGGVGGWSPNDLDTYLYRAGSITIGAPYGPMKAVVEESLSRLPASDIQDIVAYLQTAVPAKTSVAPAAVAVLPAGINGAQIYADNCARCHSENGEGVDNNFPNLAHNQSVWDGPADNIISMILGGYAPWHVNQSSMPEFGKSLSDDQIAAVANYIRTSWGNKGAADATGTQVGNLRPLASVWVDLSTGTTTAALNGGGSNQGFDDIAGNLELFGDRQNCMLNMNLTSSDPAAAVKSIYLVGSCASEGSIFQGNMVVDGKHYPVALKMQLTGTGGHVDWLQLFGPLPGSAMRFDTRIALSSSSD